MLAIFTGLICFAAGALRLGFVADFVSRPILIGFLNGVAVSIFLGQIGKVFGFPMESHGIIPSFIEFVGKVPQTHWRTLAVGLLTIAVMLVSKRLLPRWPGPLLAVVAAVAVVKALGLEDANVAVVGAVPAGLPRLRWPTFDPQLLQPLFGGALGVALVSFCFSLLIGAVLLLVFEEREHRRIAFSIGLAAFFGIWVGHGVGGPVGRSLLVGAQLLAASCFAFALYGILRGILARRVSGDTILGAVCGYLLLGIIWSLLYYAVETATTA